MCFCTKLFLFYHFRSLMLFRLCLCSAVGGWLATLCVAGYTAIAVRKLVKTEMTDAEPMSKPSPFSLTELWAWTGVFLISFVAALFYPTALGTSARTCLPFLLASTVLGYMVGSWYNFISHPFISSKPSLHTRKKN